MTWNITTAARCWRTTFATARMQTLDNGAPVASGTVRVEMGHKSLYMLTRVYERVGDVRARPAVVEYRRPDGRLPGEALLRQVLGTRFDEILGTGEVRPTLRIMG